MEGNDEEEALSRGAFMSSAVDDAADASLTSRDRQADLRHYRDQSNQVQNALIDL